MDNETFPISLGCLDELIDLFQLFNAAWPWIYLRRTRVEFSETVRRMRLHTHTFSNASSQFY